MWRELRYYARMAAGIQAMLREPVPADPERFIQHQLLNRERTFLETLDRAIFNRPQHPYSAMFRMAGCEPGDLAHEIRQRGLEATLLRLRHEGVYLAHDEWKGRTPIVRNGREIPHERGDFKNPLVTGWMDSSSSGSSGSPVTTSRSTAAQAHAWVYSMLTASEFGLRERARINVQPILPFQGGLNHALRGQRLKDPVDRWFAEGSRRSDGHYQAATRALLWFGNALGAGAPYPTYLPPGDFSPVVEHIVRRRAEGRACGVYGFASPLVRVAAAAVERNQDISGTIFLCLGEALTPAKARVFERAGGRGFALYVISEVGRIGAACRNLTGNRVHVFSDSVAAISVPRTIPDADNREVNSLHFTTLLPYAANIFINVEMEDEGVLEPAACDCVFSRLGLTTLVGDIRSFRKISPQGMTFHGTDLLELMETALPARLGGGPGDYQLLEYEGADGQTRIRLAVSRRVGVTDVQQVRETFLELLRAQWGGALATRLWTHADAVEAVIAEPIATRSGKIPPIRTLGTTHSDLMRP